MTPPSAHAGSAHTRGPPVNPLPRGSARGSALALGALLLEALNGAPQQLVWCVDTDRDVHPRDLEQVEIPGWGALLHRFHGALDRLPWGPASCRLALVMRHRVGYALPDGCELCRAHRASGAPVGPCPGCSPTVAIRFAIPYLVDLGALCRAAPPVGVWRIWTDPAPHGGRWAPRDNLPPDYFLTGIPF